jgi:hypothetical protein
MCSASLVPDDPIFCSMHTRTPSPRRQIGRATLVATEIRSEPYPGVSIVPPRSRLGLDRRLLPGESAELVITELEPYLAPARTLGGVRRARARDPVAAGPRVGGAASRP